MSKTIVVAGYGPGISDAVARKFGEAGFHVALVGRNEERVTRGAAALSDAGVNAKGFTCDVGDPAAVARLIEDVRAALGPITVIHWNAYSGAAGDLLNADVAELRGVFDVGVVGLVAAVQASLDDMRNAEGAAVLVTGGGFAFYKPEVDAMTVQYGAMGLGVTKAAQHKLVGLLSKRLATEGVYVGEVVVLGMVKGTAFDSGNATLDPNDIAQKFWDLYQARGETTAQVAG